MLFNRLFQIKAMKHQKTSKGVIRKRDPVQATCYRRQSCLLEHDHGVCLIMEHMVVFQDIGNSLA